MQQLRDLKARGVRLSVDDFGTGQSAITYLRKFPVDTLKIDRSYVRGMVSNENDAVITSAMIAMAHQLRLDVVAEGVETESQFDVLMKWGCDEFQGFLFSPAVPADEFARLMELQGDAFLREREVEGAAQKGVSALSEKALSVPVGTRRGGGV
jgi:EAL domain-containing protein (putative c-di-GMP-specific phosphodiesterase class I)